MKILKAQCREWLFSARFLQDKHNRVATRRIPRVKNHGGQHLSKGAPLLGTPRMAGQVSPCTADGLWSATDAHTHNQTSTPSLARSATESTRRTLRVKITGGCPFQVCRGLARGAAKSLPVTSGGLCQLCRVRRRLPQPRPRRHALPSLQAPRGRLCREAVSRARRARAVIRASNHHLCSPIFRPGRAIISTDAPAPATRLLGVESRGLEPRRLSLR